MKIEHGKGQTQYGPGVKITLTGDELAEAIDLYLFAHRVYVNGARTTSVNGERCLESTIYVDPSGNVLSGDIRWLGNGRLE